MFEVAALSGAPAPCLCRMPYGWLAQDNGSIDFVGNRTECALLVLLHKLGFDYKTLREEREQDQIKVRHRTSQGSQRWQGIE
jgi:hypothetical protein